MDNSLRSFYSSFSVNIRISKYILYEPKNTVKFEIIVTAEISILYYRQIIEWE